MAQAFDPFVNSLNEKISKDLENPLRIFNWSEDNEGFHRSLYKLKNLKKWPPIVIYLGGSQEFYEKTFELKDFQTLKENERLFDNLYVQSLIMAFPETSQLVYTPYSYVKLDKDIKKMTPPKKGLSKQKLMEMSYKLFEWEVAEMVEKAKIQNSSLMLLSTPLKLDTPPRETCSHATTKGIQFKIEELFKRLEKGNFKDVYGQAEILSQKILTHPEIHYLLGMAALNLGQTLKAKEALNLATVYDCGLWRGNQVFNSIIEREAKENGMTFIDFNQLLNNSLGKNVLFIDEIYPQNFYYKKLVGLLAPRIKKILGI